MNEDRHSQRDIASTRADIAQLHKFEHWPARWMWPMLFALAFLSLAAGLADENCWQLLLLIWPLMGALMFVLVLAFHDASHGRLHPVHWVNEWYGHLIGSIMLTPLSVY